MSSISSRSSYRSTTPRKPKWQHTQFLSSSGRAATGVSKVFAQPLQGSPLRSAIDGLPTTLLGDDSSSILSGEDTGKKRVKVVEADVQDAPQPADADPEQASGPTEVVVNEITGDDGLNAGTALGPATAARSSTSPTDALISLRQSSPTSRESLLPQAMPIPAAPLAASLQSVQASLEQPSSSPAETSAPLSMSPAARRSWFSSFSRSRGKSVADMQATQMNKLAIDSSPENPSNSAPPSPTRSRPRNLDDALSHSNEPAAATTIEPPTQLTIDPPPILAISLTTEPEVAVAEVSSTPRVDTVDPAPQSEEAAGTSTPATTASPQQPTSASGFGWRLPYFGRTVASPDVAKPPSSTEVAEDDAAAHSAEKVSPPIDEGHVDGQLRQETPITDVPEVKIVLPSPPTSSDAIPDVISSTSAAVESTAPSSGPTNAPAVPSDSVPPAEVSVGEVQTEQPANAVASSSSWWGYLGWAGSSSAPELTIPASASGNVEQVATQEVPPPGPSPSHDTAVPDDHREPSEELLASEQVPVAGPDPSTQNVSDVVPPAGVPESPLQPKAPSILSADTTKTQGSAWYSPWSWYMTSPSTDQGLASLPHDPSVESAAQADGNESPKTDSEKVKEQALAGDNPAPPTGTVEPPPDAQPQQEQLALTSSLVSPSLSTNPIESSISAQRSGWASFFTSKSLLTKVVWDSDVNKIKDRPEESGMEVMNIDDEDPGEARLVADGGAESPVTTQAVVVASAVAKYSPVPSVSSSPKAEKSPLPVKEREPKKQSPPASPLTNSESIKKEITKRAASPSPSVSKKTSSGTSTPQAKPPPPNLVLPTWGDTFMAGPRSQPPPPPPQSPSQLGTIGKTLEFVSGMLFPDAAKTKAKGKGKERAPKRTRSVERACADESEANREGDDNMFGHHLPKALEILGESLDTTQLHEGCKVVVIGVAGWMPGAVTRTIAGGLPSSSSKFVNMMCSALEKFEEEHKFKFKKVTKIALEGDGTIERKTSKVHAHLLGDQGWMDDLHTADVIFVAAHSQGCIVATHLLDKLIRDGHIITPRNVDILANAASAIAPGGSLSSLPPSATRTQRICFLSLCGIHLGPLRYLRTSSLLQPYIQYFENAAARELFDFQNTESQVCKGYIESLRTVMDHGTKMVYIASLTDQVVPIYSGLFVAASHPRILRALYIDGDAYHSSDFLANLLVLLIRIVNSGLSDSGLLAHLSEATAGTLSGLGHSSPYEELATYSLAVDYLFLTSDGPDVRADLSVEPFNAVNEQNDYEIPWSLRDLIADERVARFFGPEFKQLRDAFSEWLPKTSILRDVKRKLQPIQRLSSIRSTAYASRL